MKIENTYWNHKGIHQQYVTALNAMVPVEGEVPNKRKNPCLERFRVASNCYYDLYNNGLCNRIRQFAAIFKIRPSDWRLGNYRFSQELYDRTERVMDSIVLAAAQEQNLVIEAAAA